MLIPRRKTHQLGTYFDRNSESVEVRIGSVDRGLFTTSQYETVREKDRAADAAEEVRLMYVAATRARDHLILSLYRNDSPAGKKSLAAAFSQQCSETPGLWREIAAEELLGTYAPPSKQSESKIQPKTPQDRQEWIERRQQVIQPVAEAGFLRYGVWYSSTLVDVTPSTAFLADSS